MSTLDNLSYTHAGADAGPLVLLNAPVLTDHGHYLMVPIAVDVARTLVQARGFISAIGHQAAADVLSRLLDITCPVRRIRHHQQDGEQALVLRLQARLAEGEILHTADEMLARGCSLALLTRCGPVGRALTCATIEVTEGQHKHNKQDVPMSDPRNPASYASRVLVLVCGQAPQVITETLHGLVTAPQPFVPTRVVIVTTRAGKQGIVRSLLEGGQLAALRADLAARRLPGIDPDTLAALRFGAEAVRVPANAQGVEDDDAHSEDALQRMGDLILATLCEYATDDAALHVSLAGGRKSMSYLAGLALSLAGRPQDRLSHVLLSDERFENCPDFFFPPHQPTELLVRAPGAREPQKVSTADVRVLLSDVPFVRTRLLLGEHALIDPSRPRRLSDLVGEANALLQNDGAHTLAIDTFLGLVRCDGVEVAFTQDELAFYYAVARFAQDGQPLTSRPNDADCERYLELRAHVTPGGAQCRDGAGWRDAMQEPWDALFGTRHFGSPHRLADLASAQDKAALLGARSGFFSPKRTAVNKRLREALGRLAAEPFLVQSLDGRGGRPAVYALDADTGIEFRDERPRRPQ